METATTFLEYAIIGYAMVILIMIGLYVFEHYEIRARDSYSDHHEANPILPPTTNELLHKREKGWEIPWYTLFPYVPLE